MKHSKAMQFFNIIYPVFLYFSVTVLVLYLIDGFWPQTREYKLFQQLLTSLAVLPMLYVMYRDKSTKKTVQKKQPLYLAAVMFVTGACFAVAWNTFLGMVKIEEYSASYGQVAKTFYNGTLFLEIFALCIVIPIVEELLYRGIVFKRSADFLGNRPAIFLSAVIFGLVHMNLVQFIYASVFGILLAYITDLTGTLTGAAAAHMAANLTSVLSAEKEMFSFLDNGTAVKIQTMVILFGISAVGIWTVYKINSDKI